MEAKRTEFSGLDMNWKTIKDKLCVRLLEIERNKELLSNVPYADVGNGLALAVDIDLPDNSDGEDRVVITKAMARQLDVDEETLLSAAMRNAAIIDPPVFVNMSIALFGSERKNLLNRTEPLQASEIDNMYVLTTETEKMGASALFYLGIKERVGDILGRGYYILPSSVHEIIIVPESTYTDEKNLCNLVKEANSTIVEPPEVLSDNVFHYNKETKSISVVTVDE